MVEEAEVAAAVIGTTVKHLPSSSQQKFDVLGADCMLYGVHQL